MATTSLSSSGGEEFRKRERGHLHVFLGVAPGVGKTYAMLAEGQRLADQDRVVVIGLAETHGRADTDTMVEALPRVPPRKVNYRGTTFDELNVDAILAQRPSVAVVDELAHRCVPGSRHEKRWQDVEELLDAGVDVLTALNVQHIDSLNDEVETITGVAQRETVPDVVVGAAECVDLISTTPEQLRARIARGEVIGGSGPETALAGFYSAEHLEQLHQLGMRWLVDHHLLDEVGMKDLGAGGTTGDRAPESVVVALSGTPEAEHVLRRAFQIAESTRGTLVGVYVRVPSDTVESAPPWLAGQQRLLSELGGRYVELAGIDVASIILDFARNERARHLVLGATRRSRREELLHGSVINKAIRTAGPIEVHVVPPLRRVVRAVSAHEAAVPRSGRVVLPAPRRTTAWVLAIVLPVVLTTALIPVRPSLGLAGVLLCNLLAVVGVALLGGFRPAVLATAAAFVASDFFFAPPFYSLRVDRWVDLIALITFMAVAASVGALVDLLTRQGVRVARASAEAENLARLAADSIVGSEQLVDVIGSIRRIFDLDGVAVFRRKDTGWEIEASAGEVQPESPEVASYTVEIAPGRVLALSGSRLADKEIILLRAFLDQLRFTRERSALRPLQGEDRSP